MMIKEWKRLHGHVFFRVVLCDSHKMLTSFFFFKFIKWNWKNWQKKKRRQIECKIDRTKFFSIRWKMTADAILLIFASCHSFEVFRRIKPKKQKQKHNYQKRAQLNNCIIFLSLSKCTSTIFILFVFTFNSIK